MTIQAEAGHTIKFTTTVQPSTCDLSIQSGVDSGAGGHSGAMELGVATLAEINGSSEQAPVMGKQLVLHLTDCSGVGTGEQLPTITISGDDDDVGENKIFRNASSSSVGSGFVVYYDSTAVNMSKQVDPRGTKWSLPNGAEPTTTIPEERNLNFWVALTKVSGEVPTAGTVTANVIFKFKWE